MAPEKTSAQDSLEKGALWWSGGGPRENIYWKMLKVSLCASDFSSQRQKVGEESFEGPSLPIVLMPFGGRGEKKSNMYVSESSLGLQMLIALGTVCLYTPVGKTSSNTLAQLLI